MTLSTHKWINGEEVSEDKGTQASLGSNGEINKVMAEFVDNNHLDGVWQVMSEHPAYLTSFLKTHHTLLRGDGPLPAPERHFLAIMACARHSCVYLAESHKAELLAAGGPETWVNSGLSGVPKKIQKLYELNKILAHRPWTLTPQHIEKLTKTGDDTNWSLSELVFAIVLMAHFHCLSSFVLSCVLMEQTTTPRSAAPSPKSFESSKTLPPYDCTRPFIPSSSPSTPDLEVDILVERMEKLHKQHMEHMPSKEELVERFNTIEVLSAEMSSSDGVTPVYPEPDISQFIEDPNFQYIDFAKRGRTKSFGDYHEKFSGPAYQARKDGMENLFPTFRIQDYSWDEEGYSLMNRFYGEISEKLDDKFQTICKLTYGTMGSHIGLDTTMFRTSVWNYIQCLVGIRHDDYDYAEVNDLLHRSLKKYIKTASCYPEHCSREDYQTIMRDFKESEKIHVMLLVSEAKFQSELLYALRAISSYFTKSYQDSRGEN